ncbi:hypothetical protein [Coleofasciculus sp.]|uniref:hypothetical protein n=1 Tax=Coleofasciculus sp. TaxID=3100458 RepID=UPI003A3865C0
MSLSQNARRSHKFQLFFIREVRMTAKSSLEKPQRYTRLPQMLSKFCIQTEWATGFMYYK